MLDQQTYPQFVYAIAFRCSGRIVEAIRAAADREDMTASEYAWRIVFERIRAELSAAPSRQSAA